ncbi:hypothetical protein BDV93DRAFT_610331 [Ceratobasidium sp. AG-I]|nr:hypothetical protein BDV93DRAFT_610331 [Ceratobasidium sp. AG-I]
MSDWFWGYFISFEELVVIFKDAGGILSPMAEALVAHAEREARRSIFKYIMPGRIQVLHTRLDRVLGYTFVIGLDDIELEDIDKHLRRRCRDMFLRDPDRFMYTDDPDVYTLEHDGVVHQLRYLDDIECDETSDWYYLDRYYAQLRAKAAKEQAASRVQTEPEAVDTAATSP